MRTYFASSPSAIRVSAICTAFSAAPLHDLTLKMPPFER
jgi:hypothetical protein